MKKMNQLKKAKGFTLVELIVVLVILAILAALLIPALTGYIDKANQRKATTEARNALMACQTLASEHYGTVDGVYAPIDFVVDTDAKEPTLAMAETLAEVASGTITSASTDAKGKIAAMVYNNGRYTVTYAQATGLGDPVANS